MGTCWSSSELMRADNLNSTEQSVYVDVLINWEEQFKLVTREELLLKRIEFWNNCINNDIEIWKLLRKYVESDDRSILDNAGITSFDADPGQLESVYCHDSKGFKYDIPMWVLKDPSDFLPSKRAMKEFLAEMDQKENRARVNLKFRLSTGENILIETFKHLQISTIKQQISESHGIAVERQKIVLAGEMLNDNQTLESVNLNDESVLQIQLRPARLSIVVKK